jgi:hypothetical protein
MRMAVIPFQSTRITLAGSSSQINMNGTATLKAFEPAFEVSISKARLLHQGVTFKQGTVSK